MTRNQLTFWVLSIVGLTACGKSAESGGAQAPNEAANANANSPGAPGIPWSQKTHEQRQDWMGLQVLPKMKSAFQTFDAKGFQDFKCQTCHGDDMKAVHFKMPNSLYALPTENTLAAAMDYDADTTKFMVGTVVPTMAKLLDTEPYNPQTGKGLGCFTCHPKER